MATLKMQLTCDQSADTMVEQYQRSTSSKYADVQAIAQLFEKLNSGMLKGSPPEVVVDIVENETAASGTLTFASVVATNTFVVNGVTFTCVNSGATGNQFNVGASDTLTAAEAVNAVNNSVTALVAGYVTASSSGAVVTITSDFPGLSGNQVTLAGGTHITASGTRLTGGLADPDQKTYSF